LQIWWAFRFSSKLHTLYRNVLVSLCHMLFYQLYYAFFKSFSSLSPILLYFYEIYLCYLKILIFIASNSDIYPALHRITTSRTIRRNVGPPKLISGCESLERKLNLLRAKGFYWRSFASSFEHSKAVSSSGDNILTGEHLRISLFSWSNNPSGTSERRYQRRDHRSWKVLCRFQNHEIVKIPAFLFFS